MNEGYLRRQILIEKDILNFLYKLSYKPVILFKDGGFVTNFELTPRGLECINQIKEQEEKVRNLHKGLEYVIKFKNF